MSIGKRASWVLPMNSPGEKVITTRYGSPFSRWMVDRGDWHRHGVTVLLHNRLSASLIAQRSYCLTPSWPSISGAPGGAPLDAAERSPGFAPPMLPSRVVELPKGGHWFHEIKLDGNRTRLVINAGTARLHPPPARLVGSLCPARRGRRQAPLPRVARQDEDGLRFAGERTARRSRRCAARRPLAQA